MRVPWSLKSYKNLFCACINNKRFVLVLVFCLLFLEFSMNTTHLYWLASVKSFAKIILTVFKGSGPHSFAISGVIVGSRLLWAKPWQGMCNVSLFSVLLPQRISCSFLEGFSGLFPVWMTRIVMTLDSKMPWSCKTFNQLVVYAGLF